MHTKASVETETIEALFNAAAVADKQGSTKRFLTELLTKSEQLMLGRRLLVAQMLLQGKTYFEIRNKLQTSPNTVTRTKSWLIGEFPEYGEALRRQARSTEEAKASRKQSNKLAKKYTEAFTFSDLKRKYPMHFLFFNIVEEVLNAKKRK